MDPDIQFQSTLPCSSDSDQQSLSQTFKTIERQNELIRAGEARLDNLALDYQKQIAVLAQECERLLQFSDRPKYQSMLDERIEATRKEVQEEFEKVLAATNNELAGTQDEVRKAETQKLAIEQELRRARQSEADSAAHIARLREELSEIHDSKEHSAEEIIEQHTRNMELLQQSKESESKVMKYEESNTFLRAEVNRLAKELAHSRTLMDAGNVARDTAISAANKLAAETAKDLASANTRVQKLSNEVADLERNAIDIQANFEREKNDQRAEVEGLTKLVEMHREAAKDAEIRLSGYSEVLATLAKERKETENRQSAAAIPSLDKHAEILFRELNQALDAKLHVLEKERHELIKARASEARMATKQQALLREADTAHRELQEVRQQNSNLEFELGAQKDKVAELERKLMFLGPTTAGQSASPLPFSGTGSISFGNTVGGSANRSGTAPTPSPFRFSGRLAKAEEALAGMMDLKRRHEAILTGLRSQREEYSNIMHD